MSGVSINEKKSEGVELERSEVIVAAGHICLR